MSKNNQSNNSLTQIRTFAKDVEKAQAVPETKNTTSEPKTPAESPTKPTQDSSQKQSTPVETTEKKAVQPIPKKDLVPEKKETESAIDSFADTSNNPPFHTLHKKSFQKYDEKREKKISESSKVISEHPESILESGKANTLEVSDSSAENAVFIKDTKQNHKGFGRALVESLQNGATSFIKLLTPKTKPVQTVARTEERADVLKQAASRTGVSHVEHEGVADRIRRRQQKTTTDIKETNTPKTDPVFLTELPEGEEIDNRTPDQTEVTDTQPKSIPLVPEIDLVTPATEEASTERIKNKTNEVEAEVKTDPVFLTELPEGEEAPKVIHAVQKINFKNIETSVENKNESVQVAQPSNTPKATHSPNKTNLVESEEGTTEPTLESEVEKKDIEENKTTNIQEVEFIYEPEEDNQSQEQKTVATNQLSDSEDIHDNSTNMISAQIIGAIIVCIIVVYSLAMHVPNILNRHTEALPAPVSDMVVGSTEVEIVLHRFSTAADRVIQIHQLTNNSTSNIVQITPQEQIEGVWHITTPGTVFRSLDLAPPTALRSVSEQIYFGGYQQTEQFIIIKTSDQSQALGAMLAWENTITEQLASLMKIESSDGRFRDIISNNYDLRVFLSDQEEPQLTYGIVNNFIVIARTPTTWTAIVESLR